mgnify:CR=1 FL=1
MKGKRIYRGTEDISPRQAEYIRLVFKGLSLDEVSDRMCVSLKATKYMVNLLNKKFKTRWRRQWISKFVASEHSPHVQAQLKKILNYRERR